MLCGGFWLASYIQKENMEDKLSEEIHILYQAGNNEEVVKQGLLLHERLKKNARFMFEYGCAYHKLQKYKESNVILLDALKLTSVPTVQYVIGLNYQEMQQYGEAETWLLRSTKRLPKRIYPYYLLVKLYNETDSFPEEKLQWAALMVLETEPKIHSTAIKQMREEIKDMISKRNKNE